MDENEEVTLTSANQYFIQHNYKMLPLEELCAATNLDPETVSNYITEFEEYMKDNDINVEDKFTFNININPLGNISYGVQWPNHLQTVENIVPFVGKFFYLLNRGQLKASIVQFLAKYAEERGTYKVVKDIMHVWNEQENVKKKTPIVEPHEVFRTE